MATEEKTVREIADEGKSMYSNMITMKDIQIVKWQKIAFMTIAISLISIVGLIYVATRSTFIPYIINVDEKTGYVQSLGSLKEVNHEVTDAEINYFLSRFVEDTRTIPNDTEVLQTNVKRATTYLTPETASKFKNLYLDEFTKKIGTGLNRVTVLAITPVAKTNDTYQVRWSEKFIPTGSTTPEEKSYVGTFSIKQESVDNKELLLTNPLGLMITDFSMQEERSK